MIRKSAGIDGRTALCPTVVGAVEPLTKSAAAGYRKTRGRLYSPRAFWWHRLPRRQPAGLRPRPCPRHGNARATAINARNRFSLTRQLACSTEQTRRALDLGLFINGLPIATFELKNSLTKQTVADAVEQYRRDRDPREPLFAFGRCVVHFAVDDSAVMMCTELKGKGSWFLPFNRGHNDGAGNSPNPHGLRTDYLWKELLTPAGLTDILENYAQIVEEKDPKTRKKKRKQVWPRDHQLRLVRQTLTAQ